MNSQKGKNGIRYMPTMKRKAIVLRNSGKTHREIKAILGISLGTADLWTRGIVLSQEQKTAIQQRRTAIVFTPKLRQQLGIAARKRLKPYQFKQKHTKKSLLAPIQNFYLKNNRIPTKREFGDPKVYRTYFGAWNTAIRSAGYTPNPVLFSRKHIAKDGHRCDSFSEMVIDDWMTKNKIPHARNAQYGFSKFTADFELDHGVILEFFGLAGVQSKYDRGVENKRKIAKRLGLKLIEVYPNDLFPKNRLARLIATARH